MTAQIGDIYKYQNTQYTIVALTSAAAFHPADFGLEPHASSTACYRGYWCEYNITNDKLLLKDLYLFNSDGKYPPLNGTEVSPPEFEEYECYRGNSKKPEKVTMPAHMGHRVYRDVNIAIPYTGKILLGSGFIDEYYIHMGFQRGWAYEKLIEFVFEEGILLECNDLSSIAQAQRDAIERQNENPRYPDADKLPSFIESSFSLDYDDKAWWIK